jgi:hypothetical protein
VPLEMRLSLAHQLLRHSDVKGKGMNTKGLSCK